MLLKLNSFLDDPAIQALIIMLVTAASVIAYVSWDWARGLRRVLT